MLQVLSGKFFKEKHNIKQVSDKDIFYSNAEFIELVKDKEKIKTCVGNLEFINLGFSEGVSSYLLTLNGITSIVDNAYDFPQASNQFKILLSFWFRAVFEYEKEDVERQCRKSIRNSKEETVPIHILPEYFKQDKICQNLDDFSNFIEKVITLSRNDYKSVINSLNIFCIAINAIDYNLELAYSLFVFSAESLCQEFDEFEESWEYYDENIKSILNDLVETYAMSSDDYGRLQKVLLKKEHQKLSKRFINFSMKYVDDNFFKEEAIGITNPLKKSELRSSLESVYSIRSGYVHTLKSFNKLEKLMLNKSKSEVISDETSIFLSIQGLERLIHHILKNFIMSLNDGEFEEIDLTEELPNMVNVNLAPQYWVSDAESFEPKYIYSYFHGFLSLLYSFPEDFLIYFKELMYKIEQNIKSGIKKEFKVATISFYYLCNKIHDKNGISENFNQVSSKSDFLSLLNTLTIETLITKLILLEEVDWELDDIVKIYSIYEKKRFKKNKLKLPQFYETLILAHISNTFYYRGDVVNFREYVEKIICEIPSKVDCQNYLNSCLENEKSIVLVDYVDMFFRSK